MIMHGFNCSECEFHLCNQCSQDHVTKPTGGATSPSSSSSAQTTVSSVVSVSTTQHLGPSPAETTDTPSTNIVEKFF
jgi:hypothetical protein